MLPTRCLVAFLLVLVPAKAGLNSAVIVLPTDSGRPPPAVTIVQPADYLCAVVTVRTTARDPEKQSNAMRESLQRIRTTIERSPIFQLHEGAARFAGENTQAYSNSAGTTALQTNLRVLSPLGQNADVFDAMKQLRHFIATLTPAEGTELSIASLSLAVTAPEQFRERLLALIADQTRAVQRTFGARALVIDGLQNAVVVRQLDGANVELYIDYQMSATLDSR